MATPDLGKFILFEKRTAVTGMSVLPIGIGSGSRIAILTALALAAAGAADELVPPILFNWNRESNDFRSRAAAAGVRVWTPRESLPGLPGGFRDDPRLAQRMLSRLERPMRSAFDEVHSLLSAQGAPLEILLYYVSAGGGHMPLVQPTVALAKEHWPHALHLGIFLIPTNDRAVQANLRDFPTYPDDLDIPFLFVDNARPREADRALTNLLLLALTAKRTDRNQHSLGELLAPLLREGNCLWLDQAEVRLPIVPRSFGGWLAGIRSSVAEQEVPGAVAEVLAQLGQHDTGASAFFALNGLPIPVKGSPDPQRWDEFRTHVIWEARQLAKERGCTLPEPLTSTWSSVLGGGYENNMVGLVGVRVSLLARLQTARQVIDAVLESHQPPSRWPPIGPSMVEEQHQDGRAVAMPPGPRDSAHR